jgi:hypothetical protein
LIRHKVRINLIAVGIQYIFVPFSGNTISFE